MSCGSTACNSTNNLEAASPSFPDLRWLWKIPLAWLARTALGWERRYQHRQLLRLDNRLLGDIGYRKHERFKIGRCQAGHERDRSEGDNHEHAHSHTYRSPLHDRGLGPGPRSNRRDERGQGSAGHRLQGTSRSAATRHLVRRFLAARPLRRSYQISARYEGHAPLAPRHGADRLGHVRYVLLRGRRAMGREQARGLSCRDLVFGTAKDPA